MRIAILALLLTACHHAHGADTGHEPGNPNAPRKGPFVRAIFTGPATTLGPANPSVALVLHGGSEDPFGTKLELIAQYHPKSSHGSPDSWLHVSDGMPLGAASVEDLPPGEYDVEGSLACTPASLTLPIAADVELHCAVISEPDHDDDKQLPL